MHFQIDPLKKLSPVNGKDFLPILKLVKNAIPKEVIKIMDIEFSMMRNCMKTLGMSNGFDDPSVHNSFSWYSPICFETLSIYLQPLIEKEVGEILYPTYSYARIYMHGSILKKHTDRKSSELSASCCIRKDAPWPLCFETKEGVQEFDMEPGDLVISSGTKIPHWRDPYNGTEHMQAFIQYVYAEGKYSDLKYDTRPCLGSDFELTAPYIKSEIDMKYRDNFAI